MNDINIWNKYKKIQIIYSDNYKNIYKVKNKETGDYVCIKEISKLKYSINEKHLKQINEIKSLKSENLVQIIDIIDTKYNFYIVMELCFLNLEEYMKIRKEGLLIEEIKDFLIKINNILKFLNENKIVFENLKLSKIFISLKKLNEVSYKLSCLNYNEKLKNNNENNNSPKKRSNLWNLGIIIYYLLFKEYPYEGENKKKSNIEFQLKKITNKDLKDLLNKMIYLNEEISWEEYFNHSFFIPKIEHNSFFIPKIGYLPDEHKLEFDFSSHKYQLLENYNDYDMIFKIILIGDSGVGKSYLNCPQPLKFGEFSTTISANFCTFGIKIDDKIIKLIIWDTAGQER